MFESRSTNIVVTCIVNRLYVIIKFKFLNRFIIYYIITYIKLFVLEASICVFTTSSYYMCIQVNSSLAIYSDVESAFRLEECNDKVINCKRFDDDSRERYLNSSVLVASNNSNSKLTICMLQFDTTQNQRQLAYMLDLSNKCDQIACVSLLFEIFKMS